MRHVRKLAAKVIQDIMDALDLHNLNGTCSPVGGHSPGCWPGLGEARGVPDVFGRRWAVAGACLGVPEVYRKPCPRAWCKLAFGTVQSKVLILFWDRFYV